MWLVPDVSEDQFRHQTCECGNDTQHYIPRICEVEREQESQPLARGPIQTSMKR